MQAPEQLREEAWRCLREARATADRRLGRKLAARALELAQLAEALAHAGREDQAGATAAAGVYRIYFLSGGQFVAAHDVAADNDEAALALAYALQEACTGYDDFELWRDARLVAGNAVARRQPGGSQPGGIAGGTPR